MANAQCQTPPKTNQQQCPLMVRLAMRQNLHNSTHHHRPDEPAATASVERPATRVSLVIAIRRSHQILHYQHPHTRTRDATPACCTVHRHAHTLHTQRRCRPLPCVVLLPLASCRPPINHAHHWDRRAVLSEPAHAASVSITKHQAPAHTHHPTDLVSHHNADEV